VGNWASGSFTHVVGDAHVDQLVLAGLTKYFLKNEYEQHKLFEDWILVGNNKSFKMNYSLADILIWIWYFLI